MISLSPDQVRRLRQRAQRLGPRLPDSVDGVARVVKDVCGVQAQDPSAATLAVRARNAGLVALDVERARLHERSVVRTWCLRGTLHLLATEDLGWLLSLLGPVFVKASQPRCAQLGLDEDTCVRGVRAIRDVLANQGPLTRAELVDQLAVRGIHVVGQAAYHLVRRAALEGIVCFGPGGDAEPTYALLEDWVDRGRTGSRDAAQAELVRRYLAAYGPAGPDDLAAWSGLSSAQVRAAWKLIGDQVIEVDVAGRSAWLVKIRAEWLDEPPAALPVVRLLPSFDTYLLGYRSRDLAVGPQHVKRVHPGGGLLHPTVLVDGRVLGTWRSQRRRDRLDVLVEPFDDLPPDVHPGLEAEVADLARFLGAEATLSVTAPR